MRALRIAAAALAVGVLVALPAASASAAPMLPVVMADNPLDPSTAYKLNEYRLSMLPPTVDDVLRYNPGMDRQAATDYVNQEAGRLSDQRQRASIARYGTAGNIPVNTTDAQLEQEIAAQKAGFRFPLSNAAKLARGAGTAVTALTGFEIGAAVGNGIVSLFGVDPQGTICGSGAGGILAPLTGIGDCSQIMDQAAATVNDDASAGYTFPPSCDSAGACYRLDHTIEMVQTNGNARIVYCVAATGGAPLNGTVYTLSNAQVAAGVKPGDGGQWGLSASRVSISGDPVVPDYDCHTNTAFADVANGATIPDGQKIAALGISAGTIQNGQPTPADPERKIQCVILGSDGHTYEKSGAGYHESGGKIPDAECPALPAGVDPKSVTINSVRQDTGASTQLYTGDQSPWAKEVQQKWPQCTTGLCTLELMKMPAHDSCFEGKVDCGGWYDDTGKAQDYQCEYDGTVVSLDHCNQYRQTFEPDALSSGAPYSNQDGTFSLKPTTKSAAGTALAGDASVADCVARSTASDVFTVIFNPIRCALSWAFIPAPMVLPQLTANLSDQIRATDVGRWVLAVPFWAANLSVGGCSGPAVVVGKPLLRTPQTFHPLDACTGWQASIAHTIWLCSTLLVLVLGLGAVLTSISGVLGFAGFGKGSGGGDE